jgi:hypothetical protein
MPIRVVCKACSASLTAPDAAAGKAVVCPKCKATLTVPAADSGYDVVEDDAPAMAKPKLPTPKRRVIEDDYEDEDDRPRKKKKKPQPKGVPVWAIVVPVLLVLLLIGGAIAAWFFWPKAKTPPTQVAPTMPSLFGTPPVTWTPFTSPDGSFVASFPNGPPQTASDGGAGGSGLTLPEMPGFGGAGKGGKAVDLAKDMGIAIGMYSRLDGAGMFSVSYASMPAIMGQTPSADSFWKDAKLGKQPDGSELLAVEPTTVGGYPGKRALARLGGNLVDTRITVVKGRTFTVKAAVQTSGNDSPLFKDFFDAFAIKNVPDPKPITVPGLEIPKDLDPLKKP